MAAEYSEMETRAWITNYAWYNSDMKRIRTDRIKLANQLVDEPARLTPVIGCQCGRLKTQCSREKGLLLVLLTVVGLDLRRKSS